MEIKHLLYFLSLNMFLSCQDGNKEVIETWENGNEKKVRLTERSFSFETNYFEDGKVESKGVIKDETKEKDWIYYYPNGNVRQKTFYKEGKPFKEAEYFHENGNIKRVAEYSDIGLKTGYWESYSSTGKIKSKGRYSQGRKVKKWSYYNLEGGLEKEEYLDNFGRSDYENIYNEEGELVRHSDFYKPNGLKFEFYKIDSSSNKISYRSYYQNGNIEFEGTRINSHEIGVWTYWYQNGVKKAQGNFTKDFDKLKHKDIIQVNQKISFRLPTHRTGIGIKVGKWKYWNKSGEKLAEIDFKVKGNKIVDKLIYVNWDLLKKIDIRNEW